MTMYHQYTIQPIYNPNVCQQYPVIPISNETKNPGVNTETTASQYNNSHVQTYEPINSINDVAKAPLQEPAQKIINKRNKTVVDTSNFTIEQRLIAAVWVHERKTNHIGISQIKKDFRQRFDRDPPAKNTLLTWERKLFSTGNVCDAPRSGRPVNRRSHLEEVSASVRVAPALSLRARARVLRVPRTTLRALLRDHQGTQ